MRTNRLRITERRAEVRARAIAKLARTTPALTEREPVAVLADQAIRSNA